MSVNNIISLRPTRARRRRSSDHGNLNRQGRCRCDSSRGMKRSPHYFLQEAKTRRRSPVAYNCGIIGAQGSPACEAEGYLLSNSTKPGELLLYLNRKCRIVFQPAVAGLVCCIILFIYLFSSCRPAHARHRPPPLGLMRRRNSRRPLFILFVSLPF